MNLHYRTVLLNCRELEGASEVMAKVPNCVNTNNSTVIN